MVLNTITLNMEKLIMKRINTKHHLEALALLDKGWTPKRIAKKFNVTVSAISHWKSRYSKTTNKTTTKLSKNGVIDTNHATTTLVHKIQINFEDKWYNKLVELSKHEVRTPQDQVKYLVHKELVRLYRNTSSDLNDVIPF